MNKNTSTQSVVASPLISAGAASRSVSPISLKPEWLRIPEAIRLFGIGRSTLYELLSGGQIKSASIRKRGNTRGIRLISVDSLMQYIEEQAEQTSK